MAHLSRMKEVSKNEFINLDNSSSINENSVIIRGSDVSTLLGDDDDIENSKYSNHLMKNPDFYKSFYEINNIKKDYTVAIYKGEQIKASSFNTLRPNQWLENDLLDICLSILTKKLESKIQVEKYHIGQLLFTTGISDREIVEIANNFELRHHILLLPTFDMTKQHFFLIMVDSLKKKFVIFDSAKFDNDLKISIIPYYEKIYSKYLILAKAYNNNIRNSRGNLFLPTSLKKVFFPRCLKQDGNDDCGIFVILFVEQILKTESYKLEKVDVVKTRSDLQHDILKYSDSMIDICLMCGKETSGETIRCSSCHRYFHGKEINVNIKNFDVTKQFICFLCKNN